jgi:iron uptake system EfeUOB component EfeO/EfeM
MSAPERCNCGAEDCPRCYPLNRKQAAVTERDRADALTDIVEEVMDYGRYPRSGRAQVDLYDFIADHLDTSYAVELLVAVLSTNKHALQPRIERLYTQVEQMLKSHYADTDMIEEYAQDIANERSE